jgi:hypothetical protein
MQRKKIQLETNITQKPMKATPNKENVKPVEEPKKAYGIKETTELITFIASVLYATMKAFADGKFHWTEARLYFDSLRLAPSAIGGINDVANEIKDLDSIELEQIEAHIIKVLRLPEPHSVENAKILIAKAFDTWRILTNLFKSFRV